MSHKAALLAAATSAVSATISEWVSVGAGGLTIILGVRELYKISRRKRQRRRLHLPKPPAPLPLTRVRKEVYEKSVRDWELYGAQIEQYFKDQRDSE